MIKMLGLYVHVPFCLQKCAYCDFYSMQHGEWDSSLLNEYREAVIRNLKHCDERFDTVYFGGGTPYLMSYHLRKILFACSLSDDPEITVECNPEAVDRPSLEYLLQSSVNRLSFGVQSLSDRELTALGRIHSADKAKHAIILAHKLGFENISADIMLGIPHQTKESLARTIEELCELPITHISAYILKIEKNTPFGKNPPKIPDDDEQAELYLTAVSLLEKNGFFQYEISNFAKTGRECRHNLKYWRCEEYLGIGPASHSYYKGERFFVPYDLKSFISSEIQPVVKESGSAGDPEEFAMLKLRLREGLKLSDYKLRGGCCEKLKENLKEIPANLIKFDGETISLTAEGFLVSNSIILKLTDN